MKRVEKEEEIYILINRRNPKRWISLYESFVRRRDKVLSAPEEDFYKIAVKVGFYEVRSRIEEHVKKARYRVRSLYLKIKRGSFPFEKNINTLLYVIDELLISVHFLSEEEIKNLNEIKKEMNVLNQKCIERRLEKGSK